VLALLNDTPVDSEKVQNTRREILAAIEAELEANSSLHWKQFLTMGIVDNTRMKIIRRLCMCFWLPMIREWMGSSLIAYYSTSSLPPSLLTQCLCICRFRHIIDHRQALPCLVAFWCLEHLFCARLRATLLHYRARRST
jgi:hypothetical protein